MALGEKVVWQAETTSDARRSSYPHCFVPITDRIPAFNSSGSRTSSIVLTTNVGRISRVFSKANWYPVTISAV